MALNDRIEKGILGDIRPRNNETAEEDAPRDRDVINRDPERINRDPESDEAMQGGSRHDETRHPGSRDVTEGVSGGLGTETGGSRNYRQGTGATGGDIGNRPE